MKYLKLFESYRSPSEGLKVGDIFKLNIKGLYGFAFDNKGGGTGMSNWEYDEKYNGKEAVVKTIKAWHDDETGWRGIGEPVNKELKDYLKKVSKKQNVYFSEFDITKKM